jgi:nucleoside-triphosphatase THEP1
MNNEPTEVNSHLGIPNSVLSKLAVNKYNETYSDLNESEIETIRTIINSDEVGKQELYANTIRECITLVDETLKECSLDVKEKLLKTKDNLLSRKYIKESFISDIGKILELKKNLK